MREAFSYRDPSPVLDLCHPNGSSIGDINARDETWIA